MGIIEDIAVGTAIGAAEDKALGSEKENKKQSAAGCLGRSMVNIIFLIVALVCWIGSVLSITVGEMFSEKGFIVLGFGVTAAYVLVIFLVPYLRRKGNSVLNNLA